MAMKVESYKSSSGRLFLTEEAAVRHDAMELLIEAVPELALIRPRIEANLNAIAAATAQVHSLRLKNHPEAPAENHPEVVATTLRERCGAVQHSDQMTCAGCNLTWDVNDPLPPACKPPVAVDHGELAGTCDCAAGMNGDPRHHHRTCPSYRPTQIERSTKPRLNVCPGGRRATGPL